MDVHRARGLTLVGNSSKHRNGGRISVMGSLEGGDYHTVVANGTAVIGIDVKKCKRPHFLKSTIIILNKKKID